MPKQSTPFNIMTSDKFGSEFCSHECEHVERFIKFPLQLICKATGGTVVVDKHERYVRTPGCKYLFGEEVPDRFWSPMRGV